MNSASQSQPIDSASSGPAGMRFVAGGEFAMGSDRHYPEEAPSRRVRVGGFWIDETLVTNAEFGAFVAATGYVTLAEMPPDAATYHGMDPALAQPGSLVFERSPGPVPLESLDWWDFRLGAAWHRPLGLESDLAGLDDHPVVHVACQDAEAYAAWAGKSLPTEAEWEYAARGGLDAADYAWGDTLAPEGRMLANYWQGAFPFANQLLDGWERTSPVRTYPANGHGLFDMIGNVWEWTADWYSTPKVGRKPQGGCCVPRDPRGGNRGASMDRADRLRIPRRVLKGGSHLCAETYCQRYRPAARYPQPIDTSTGHVGFRCVTRGLPGDHAPVM